MAVVARYSEIGLKGKNRSFFENRLVDNIKSCLDSEGIKYEKVEKPYGRIVIWTDNECSFLKRMFGVVSFSNCVSAGYDIDEIKEKSDNFLKKLSKEMAFRVSCQRIDKNFPISSMEVERQMGKYAEDKTGAKVKLKGFDFELGIEIIDGKALIFSERQEGPGGLPVGVSGKAIAIIENDRSLLAALLMMKRGLSVSAAVFGKKDISILENYNCGKKINVIHANSVGDLEDEKGKAVISGQSVENFDILEIARLVLRPIIAYDDKEAGEMLEEFRKN